MDSDSSIPSSGHGEGLVGGRVDVAVIDLGGKRR